MCRSSSENEQRPQARLLPYPIDSSTSGHLRRTASPSGDGYSCLPRSPLLIQVLSPCLPYRREEFPVVLVPMRSLQVHLRLRLFDMDHCFQMEGKVVSRTLTPLSRYFEARLPSAYLTRASADADRGFERWKTEQTLW